MKRRLDNLLTADYSDTIKDASCETMALEILDFFKRDDVVAVDVSEDGENGSLVLADSISSPMIIIEPDA